MIPKSPEKNSKAPSEFEKFPLSPEKVLKMPKMSQKVRLKNPEKILKHHEDYKTPNRQKSRKSLEWSRKTSRKLKHEVPRRGSEKTSNGNGKSQKIKDEVHRKNF